MSAIITENFRRNNAASFLADIASTSNSYYLGIGKSDKWAADESNNSVVPTPSGNAIGAREILSNLITCLKITPNNNSTLVIPNVKFVLGQVYKQYDPNNSDCFLPSESGGVTSRPCYVNEGGRIYLCLKNNNGAVTTVAPITTSYEAVLNAGADGYVWIRVGDVQTQFDTDQFIGISSAANTSALAAIKSDGGGLLYGFTILNGGSNYTGSTLTFRARRDATSFGGAVTADFVCPITRNGNGTITSISLPSDYSYTADLSSGIIDGAFINFTGGTGAEIVANIAPLDGFAKAPSRTLPAWYVGVSIDANDNISGDGFYIPFRQISIIKNPESPNNAALSGKSISSATTLATLPYLVLPSGATEPTVATGTVITFPGSATRALYDTYAIISNENRVYFHQNGSTGYGIIPSSGTFTSDGGGNFTYDSVVSVNEYIPNSGDVVFTENRLPVFRQSGQTEEIKIIIQF